MVEIDPHEEIRKILKLFFEEELLGAPKLVLRRVAVQQVQNGRVRLIQFLFGLGGV